MAEPITIPNSSVLIPLNLSSSHKTLTLPVVSSNPGRLIIFKDMFGNAQNSTLRLSTIGLDRIELSNVSSMVLSNSYGGWTFMNDGITNWFLTNVYLNNLVTVGPAPLPLPFLSNIIVDLRGTSYSSGGATWTNSVDNSTWSMSNTSYDSTNGGPLFNGTNSFASRSSVTNWSGSTFTVICYYYKSSTASDGQLLTVNRTSSNIENQFFFTENTAFVYSGGFGFNFSTTVTTNTVGVFMLSFVKNGATGTFYRNASPNGTQTTGLNVTVTNANFCIGKDFRDNIRFLAGTMKRYLIYNIALTDSDIANIYSILSSS
jgi:hypothetical protein